MSDLRLTNAHRAAIKAALRTWAKDNGVKLDSATKADLLSYAERAGLDVMALVTVDDAATETAAPAEARETEAPAAAHPDKAAILAAWRDMDVDGFHGLLDGLVARANAAPQVIEVERIVEVPAPALQGATIAPAAKPAKVATVYSHKPVSSTTVREAFGARAHSSKALGEIKMRVWDYANAPAVDPHYEWPRCTASLIATMRAGLPVMLFGPAGTGKSSWAQQIAAHTKRPFFTISCDNTTDAVDLVGGKGLDSGSTVWEDGMLTAAIRVPGAIILVDEPSSSRAGALYVFQTVLTEGKLHIKTTGETVALAEGVSFVFADNTNGTGDASGQYVASNQLSYATRDRMGATALIGYMPADREAKVLTAKVSGCSKALADLLVGYATITRQQVAKGDLPHAIGLRRLLSWSRLLVAGVPETEAAELAFLNMCAPEEGEALRQLMVTHASPDMVRAALNGTASQPTAAPAPAAATAFAPVQED
jgi:cobaltochelatase CobS